MPGMKKLGLFAFVGLLVAQVSAQKINVSEVPELVRAAFNKSYPNAKPVWEKESGNFEASFKEEGKEVSVIIDHKGMILETETGMAVTELPATALEYLKSHYKGMKVKEAAKIVKAGGEIMYEAGMNGKDILFDADGKFLKEVKD